MILRAYLRVLAAFYLMGFFFHFFDLLGVRLDFQKMSPLWKGWTVYLLCADLLASIGLWRRTRWGVVLFLAIASSQLVAYVGFAQYFGDQSLLIWFHLISIGTFLALSGLKRMKNRG